jgi:predicted nucleic acid-binding protein
MVLVDSSVWIDHLRRHEARLAALLEDGQVLIHPFVVGELALGNLRQWSVIRPLLESLPVATRASDLEVLHLIEQEDLHASGLGWVDAHLLAAARLSASPLWSRDRTLTRAAARLGVAAPD